MVKERVPTSPNSPARVQLRQFGGVQAELGDAALVIDRHCGLPGDGALEVDRQHRLGSLSLRRRHFLQIGVRFRINRVNKTTLLRPGHQGSIGVLYDSGSLVIGLLRCRL